LGFEEIIQYRNDNNLLFRGIVVGLIIKTTTMPLNVIIEPFFSFFWNKLPSIFRKELEELNLSADRQVFITPS